MRSTLISYSVSQRTREIGIRLALGAREQAVRRMFVRRGRRAHAPDVLAPVRGQPGRPGDVWSRVVRPDPCCGAGELCPSEQSYHGRSRRSVTRRVGRTPGPCGSPWTRRWSSPEPAQTRASAADQGSAPQPTLQAASEAGLWGLIQGDRISLAGCRRSVLSMGS